MNSCQIVGCNRKAVNFRIIPYFMKAKQLIATIAVCNKHASGREGEKSERNNNILS